MKKDNIDNLFEDLKGHFDIETPNYNHEQRFLNKLKTQNSTSNNYKKTYGFNWKPFLMIAATLVIGFAVFINLQNQNKTLDLANVSSELSETQDFFTTTISGELKKLNKERSPLTEQIISDALAQIQTLETDYQKLKTDLTESNKNQRVIYAMISNFQNRIDILNTVLEQIQTIKELKSYNNEPKHIF